MAVWGIGAYYPGEKEDKAKEFIENGIVMMGYSEERRPDYYVTLRSIQPGDIIFIKARFMLNKPLRIKAIGIAADTVSIKDGTNEKEVLPVNWIKDLTDQPVDIEKEHSNDGSTKTIYQERDPEIINQIVELLKK